jgi:hypothetical protein
VKVEVSVVSMDDNVDESELDVDVVDVFEVDDDDVVVGEGVPPKNVGNDGK